MFQSVYYFAKEHTPIGLFFRKLHKEQIALWNDVILQK
jgi:hypothetical protein